MRTLGLSPSQYQAAVPNKNKKHGKPLAQLHKEIINSLNLDGPDVKRLSQHFHSTKGRTQLQSVLHDDKYTPKACAVRQVKSALKDIRKVNWNHKYDAEHSTVLQRLLQTKIMAEKYFNEQKQQFSTTRAVQKLMTMLSEKQSVMTKSVDSQIKRIQKVPAVLTPLYLYLMVFKIYLDDKIAIGMGENNTIMLYDKIQYSLEVLTSKTSEQLVSSPSGILTFAKLKEKLNCLDENFKLALKAERESYYQLDLSCNSKAYRKIHPNRKAH